MLMIIFESIFLFPLTTFTILGNLYSPGVGVLTYVKLTDRQSGSVINKSKQKTVGISINLYRLPKAEKLSEIKNLEQELARTADTRVNLYKVSGDLAIIFLNTTDPYRYINSIPYRMLYGNPITQSVSIGDISGFIPSSEVPAIAQWITSNKIETYEGFSKIYDSLSAEVKKELVEMGTDEKADLFNGYIRPLCILYFTAMENENAMVFIGQ